MFCPKCGSESSDEANFCWKCGRLLRSSTEDITPSSTPVPRWEYCEIAWEKPNYFTLRFWARAVGSQGTYVAAESDFVRSSFWQRSMAAVYSFSPDKFNESHHAVLNGLIKKLAADGWEPVSEMGDDWFSYKFRRLDR